LKRTYKLILFLIIFLSIAVALDKVLSYGLENANVNEWGRWNRLKKGYTKADVIVMGSSRALVHFNCNILDSITGFKFYNIGLNSHIINYQLPLLKTYIKYNNVPKYVLLNVDISFLWIQKKIPGIENYLNVINEPAIYDNLITFNPEMFFYRYIPMYGFVITRTPILYSFNSLYDKTRLTADPLKGFEPVDSKFNNDLEKFVSDKQDGYLVDVSDDGVNSLNEYIAFCKNNKINLILVYSPDFYQLYKYQQNRKEIKDLYYKITTENNIPFMDYSDSCSISYKKEYFYNSQHLNKMGADVFSIDLAEKLCGLLKN